MDDVKPIEIDGKPIAGGRCPAICAPLVAAGRAALRDEVDAVVAKAPDVLEWRADFFEHVADTAAVVDMAREIRQRAGTIPLLFTCRAEREGGQGIARTASGIADLLAEVSRVRAADIVDYELANAPADIARVRAATRAAGVKLVLSHHDFARTPEPAALRATLDDAERAGADIAKLAAMPRDLDDVLVLLAATLDARRRLSIPIITMSMGPYGALSRMIGGVFGSALTFAVGRTSSAPGQLPIDDLRSVLAIVRRSVDV
jgi:3-dehydroquinate dehydratase-1